MHCMGCGEEGHLCAHVCVRVRPSNSVPRFPLASSGEAVILSCIQMDFERPESLSFLNPSDFLLETY